MKKTLKIIFLSAMVLAFFACSEATVDAPHFTKSVAVHFKSDEVAEKEDDTIVSVLINAHKSDKHNTSLAEPLYFIPSEKDTALNETGAVFDTKSNIIVLKIEVTRELEDSLAWKMFSGQLSNYERLKQDEYSLLVSFPMKHNDMVSFLSAGGTISLYNVPILTYKNTRTLSTIDIYDYQSYHFSQPYDPTNKTYFEEFKSEFDNFQVAQKEKTFISFNNDADKELDFEQYGFIFNGNKIWFDDVLYLNLKYKRFPQKECWVFDTNKKKFTLYTVHPTKNIMEKINVHLSENDFNTLCKVGGTIYISSDVVAPVFDDKDDKYRRF